MFQRFVETQSPKLIAHELNQDGLTSRKKKAWINTYVARILKNPVYVGDVEYKGEIFKGEHEAIVSRQTWNRVQEIIKSNCPYERSGGITEITVPLKGILRCGHCGCAMIPVFCTKGKKRYYYYYCNTDFHRSEKLCPVGKIGSSIIEDAVKEQTVRIFSSTFFQETIFKATGITVAELQRIFRDEFWLECSSLELNRLYSELFEKITVHEHQLAYEILLPQFNTCSSSGVFDRLLVKKSFDLLRLFLNASHMGFCMFFKLSIPFCRRSFGKGRFQIPVQ